MKIHGGKMVCVINITGSSWWCWGGVQGKEETFKKYRGQFCPPHYSVHIWPLLGFSTWDPQTPRRSMDPEISIQSLCQNSKESNQRLRTTAPKCYLCCFLIVGSWKCSFNSKRSKRRRMSRVIKPSNPSDPLAPGLRHHFPQLLVAPGGQNIQDLNSG